MLRDLGSRDFEFMEVVREIRRFYQYLNDRNFVIYPGKVSDADCFRIGSIGRIFEAEVRGLLAAIRDTLAEMEIEL